MQVSRRWLLGASLAIPFTAFPGRSNPPTFLELATDDMASIGDALWAAPIADNLWVYSGTAPLAGGHYPYNGMLAIDGEHSLLVDTGWTGDHGETLMNWAAGTLGKPIRTAIATHFHSDRTGGMAPLRRAGIPTLAHPMTTGLARALGAPEPDPIAELARGAVDIGPLELFYPGPGHAPDNITVYHRPSRTLFGGCLVKAITAGSLGNLEDAVVERYDSSLAALEERYADRSATIPGHGTMAGDSIGHSRTMAQQLAARD